MYPPSRPPRPNPFFGFSKSERVGVAVLLAFSAVCLSSRYWLPLVWPAAPRDTFDYAAYEEQIEDWRCRTQALRDSIDAEKAARRAQYAEWDRQRERRRARRSAYTDGAAPQWSRGRSERAKRHSAEVLPPLPAPESLDPNTVDSATLRALRLPAYLARQWLRYRRKGGSFRDRDDIGKLYNLPDTTRDRILAYFAAPESGDTVVAAVHPAAESPPRPVQLNRASAEELVALRGIGDYTAERILDYRERLGGFVSADQLSEVPGLRAGALDSLAHLLVVDPADVRRLRINELRDYQLARHPYLTREQAEVLTRNIVNRGAFASRADLLATVVLDRATVDRLMPYVDFGVRSPR